ncbi:MAG: PTS sugar transporter subunit IIA, partial [bacterium]
NTLTSPRLSSTPTPPQSAPAKARPAMNLLDILQPECVKAPLVATGKRGCIDELVDLMAATGKVAEVQALKDAIWTREQTRTTGIGHGLAIPHGKCAGVRGIIMAIGKPAEPIDFGAIDGKPVRLIIMLASSPDRNSDHIQALARVSRIMMLADFRERIYQAATGQELFALLKEQESR